jgi:hypothetical protein
MTNAIQDVIPAGRDRPATDEIEITPEMVSEGVFALAKLCPFDFAFPVGGEDEAVVAVLRAALAVRRHRGSESTEESSPHILVR